MPRWGGRLAAWLVLLWVGALPAAAKPLSLQEEKALTRCEAVLAPGPGSPHLDPTQAAVCLKVLAITGTLSGDMADEKLDSDARTRVNRMFMGASALKDLGDVFSLHRTSGPLRVALSQRTFCTGPLHVLGLGPSPKLLLDWAARYRPAQAPLLALVMRSWGWDVFPEVMRPHLLAKIGGSSGGDWDGLCLEKRFAALFAAAELAADELLAAPAASLDEAALARMRQAALFMRPYLEDDKERALDGHLARVQRYLALRKRYAGGSGSALAPAKLEEYSSKLRAGDLSLSEHMRYLSAIYGEDLGKGEGKGSPGRPEHRPSLLGYEDALAALLVAAMKDEIKGTRSGDRILAFYKDKSYPAESRTLALRIAPLGHNLGMYGGQGISMSRENIESWMLQRKVFSAADLVNAKDRRLLRELARYLAPTFVHEATHQEQHAWLTKNGLPNRYYVEREVEAMGVGALYVLEKNLLESRRGNDSYLQSIHVLEVDRARRLYEDGLTGVRRFVAPAYSQITSFDTYSAEDFELAEAIQKELAKRALRADEAEEDKWRTPDFSSYVSIVGRVNEIPDLRTEKLRQLMRDNFSGYKKLSVRLDKGDAWVSDGLREFKRREGGQ
jgi:hypothetical protein